MSPLYQIYAVSATCFPFVIMTVDNRAEHLGYFPEIPDVLYGYPQIRSAFSLKKHAVRFLGTGCCG